MRRFLIGLIIGLALWPIGVGCYFLFGNPPVAVADNPLPMEPEIAKSIRHRRISSQQPKSTPIQLNEDTMMAGAKVYANNCAACHGMYSETSIFSQHMYPSAPQLWQVHGSNRVIGVSDDPVGETYWKVSNGIRLSGMPAFKQVLTPTQIWQVSLLLANAGNPLPPQVKDVLSQAIPNVPSQPPTPGQSLVPAAPSTANPPQGTSTPSIPSQPAGSSHPSGNAPQSPSTPGHP